MAVAYLPGLASRSHPSGEQFGGDRECGRDNGGRRASHGLASKACAAFRFDWRPKGPSNRIENLHITYGPLRKFPGPSILKIRRVYDIIDRAPTDYSVSHLFESDSDGLSIPRNAKRRVSNSRPPHHVVRA